MVREQRLNAEDGEEKRAEGAEVLLSDLRILCVPL
jgi:hypothetical protein